MQRADRRGAARVLLVNRSADELRNLEDSLADGAFEFEQATSIGAARDLLHRGSYDAVLLEGELADPEGFALMKETETPVIVASLPADHDLMMSAFSAGAADFYCGSVTGVEVATRLRNLINKRNDGAESRTFRFGQVEFDPEQRSWICEGRSIHLSHHEAAFLAALLAAPRYFCTYSQLLEKIWGPGSAVETQNLRVLVGQVRRKIDPSPDKPRLLLTVTGVGYKLGLDPGTAVAAEG